MDGGEDPAMRFDWFHLMPYPFLRDDFKQKYHSVWLDGPSTLYDPELDRRRKERST
jgi:hypothetical protein